MAAVAMNTINQLPVDIPQLQTPIPPGNERHRSINAGTGELRPLSSRAMAPPAPASAFQACGLRVAPGSEPRAGPTEVVSWTAPDRVAKRSKSEVPGIDTVECVGRLGTRTAGILRGAMIAQQDLFTDQLWELHRLTRVQGQKMLLLSTSASGVADAWAGVGSSLFSRQLQSDLHTETMESIASLPTVPLTLRRHPARKRARPVSTGPSDINAVPQPLDGSGETGKVSVRATAPVSLAECVTQQSAKVVRQGTLDSLCKQHNVAAPAVPSANTVEAVTKSAVPPLDSAIAPDVSSLLNFMLPPAGVNPHLQWYQKNAAPALAGLPEAAGATPGPVATFHQTMDVPMPETADPKALAPSAQTGPTISSSLWSNSSFAFLPGAMPPPPTFGGNPLGDAAAAGLLPYPTMPKFGPNAFRLPSHYAPLPLSHNLLGQHMPLPGDGHTGDMLAPPAHKSSLAVPAAPTRSRSKRVPKPANSAGSGNSQRFSGAHSQLDAVPTFGTQQGESLGAVGLPECAPGDNDKSAADILLSLRGH